MLPALVGLNTTLNVQVPAKAKVAPQVLAENAYCDGFVPPNARGDSVTTPAPPLRSVTVVAALVAPTLVRANEMEVGEVVSG